MIILNHNIVCPGSQRGIVRSFGQIRDALCQILPAGDLRDWNRTGWDVRSDKMTTSLNRSKVERLLNRMRLEISDLSLGLASRFIKPKAIFNAYYGIVRCSCPQVCIVYDMIHEMYPQYFPVRLEKFRRFINIKKQCIQRSAVLMTISKQTTDDLLRIYPEISRTKIFTIPLAVDSVFLSDESNPTKLQTLNFKSYFLFVGNRGLYKNFARFIEGFARARLQSDFEIKIASPITFDQSERRLISELGIEDCISLKTNCSDQELSQLYRHARALIVPSEYEGFGLPILEGMASGTLVGISQSLAFSKEASDIVITFDHTSAASIAEALLKIANIPEVERARRISSGKLFANQYSLENFKSRLQELLTEL